MEKETVFIYTRFHLDFLRPLRKVGYELELLLRPKPIQTALLRRFQMTFHFPTTILNLKLSKTTGLTFAVIFDDGK